MKHALVITSWNKETDNHPALVDDFACGWEDKTGQQANEHGEIEHEKYSILVKCANAMLTSIKTQYPVVWEQEVFEEGLGEKVANPDFEAMMENVYSHDIVEYCTCDHNDPDEIQELIIECQKRPMWKAGISVHAGENGEPPDVYAYGDNLYRCVQAHTTQSDWTPDITPALWVRFHEVEEGPQPWQQPAGAHDAYMAGVQVTYNGHLWQNTSDYNVYAPGVWGWTDLGVYP